jgi:ribosomal protein RSM22 (predicted rRNA methylase)
VFAPPIRREPAMTSPALPPALAAAIDARLEGRARKALAERARRLSEAYRARKTTRDAIRDADDALAYGLTRMPATYAAAAAVLTRLAEEQPDLAPESLLDVGCGLGAASYAARAAWPLLDSVELLDRSRPFLDLATALATESGALPALTVTTADIVALPAGPPRDLVVVGYALTELADADLPDVARALWARAGAALVVVEPGTPRDHDRLMRIRAALVSAGAHVLGPCPHAAPCPLAAPDWCHFSVRLPRSREHKLLKGAEAPFEDEKFAWLAVGRQGRGKAARVLAPPRHGKAGVTAKLCEVKGLREIFLPKRDKPRYEGFRRLIWGDALDMLPEDDG